MRIGVPRESKPAERRVAVTPAAVQRLVKLGYEVLVQAGAGIGASYGDQGYAEAGIANGWHPAGCDLLAGEVHKQGRQHRY